MLKKHFIIFCLIFGLWSCKTVESTTSEDGGRTGNGREIPRVDTQADIIEAKFAEIYGKIKEYLKLANEYLEKTSYWTPSEAAILKGVQSNWHNPKNGEILDFKNALGFIKTSEAAKNISFEPLGKYLQVATLTRGLAGVGKKMFFDVRNVYLVQKNGAKQLQISSQDIADALFHELGHHVAGGENSDLEASITMFSKNMASLIDANKQRSMLPFREEFEISKVLGSGQNLLANFAPEKNCFQGVKYRTISGTIGETIRLEYYQRPCQNRRDKFERPYMVFHLKRSDNSPAFGKKIYDILFQQTVIGQISTADHQLSFTCENSKPRSCQFSMNEGKIVNINLAASTRTDNPRK